jgi:hypothetical protein
VGQVIFGLAAFAQQAQVGLGATEVIVDTAADPIVIGMGSYAVAHDLGDYFKRFGE